MSDNTNATDCGPAHPLTAIQTDVFCQSCGSNLYREAVWRTEDTHLLVVTCPRCGKLAPAAEAMPYRRVWRQRLGLTLSLSWIILLLGGFATVLSIEVALLDEAPRLEVYRTPSGATMISIRRVIDWDRTRRALAVFIPISVGITLVTGSLVACALYHWRRRWHVVLAVAVPVLAFGLAGLLSLDSTFARHRFIEAPEVYLIVMGSQILGGIVGVCIGRPVGRGLVRALLPNRTRQFFAFLWRRDGKDLPLGPY